MHVSFIQDLDHLSHCPNCNANWDAGDIFETLRQQEWCRDKPDDELRQLVQESYSPPYHFSRVIGIETDDYDGVSFWQCPDCQARWRRFND
jgi:hypothetical protein